MSDVDKDKMYPYSRWRLKSAKKISNTDEKDIEFNRYHSIPAFNKSVGSLFSEEDVVHNLETILSNKLTPEEKSILISTLPHRRGGITYNDPHIITSLRQTV